MILSCYESDFLCFMQLVILSQPASLWLYGSLCSCMECLSVVIKYVATYLFMIRKWYTPYKFCTQFTIIVVLNTLLQVETWLRRQDTAQHTQVQLLIIMIDVVASYNFVATVNMMVDVNMFPLMDLCIFSECINAVCIRPGAWLHNLRQSV